MLRLEEKAHLATQFLPEKEEFTKEDIEFLVFRKKSFKKGLIFLAFMLKIDLACYILPEAYFCVDFKNLGD